MKNIMENKTLKELKDFYDSNKKHLDSYLSDNENYDTLFRKLDILISDLEDFDRMSRKATILHDEDLYLELEYYKDLANENYPYNCEYDRAVSDICLKYDIPEEDYLSGEYEFEDDECDEFMLDLVNTIAEYFGIDNHYVY